VTDILDLPMAGQSLKDEKGYDVAGEIIDFLGSRSRVRLQVFPSGGGVNFDVVLEVGVDRNALHPPNLPNARTTDVDKIVGGKIDPFRFARAILVRGGGGTVSVLISAF
jgi:hypothetical protein